jgi:hypothetical protein
MEFLAGRAVRYRIGLSHRQVSLAITNAGCGAGKVYAYKSLFACGHQFLETGGKEALATAWGRVILVLAVPPAFSCNCYRGHNFQRSGS